MLSYMDFKPHSWVVSPVEKMGIEFIHMVWYHIYYVSNVAYRSPSSPGQHTCNPHCHKHMRYYLLDVQHTQVFSGPPHIYGGVAWELHVDVKLWNQSFKT